VSIRLNPSEQRLLQLKLISRLRVLFGYMSLSALVPLIHEEVGNLSDEDLQELFQVCERWIFRLMD